MNEFTEEERRTLEVTVCEMESQVTLIHVLSNVQFNMWSLFSFYTIATFK